MQASSNVWLAFPLNHSVYYRVVVAVLGRRRFGQILCTAKDNSKEPLFTVVFRLMGKWSTFWNSQNQVSFYFTVKNKGLHKNKSFGKLF